MSWMVAEHSTDAFDAAHWMPKIADCFALVTSYAAGLYAGLPRRHFVMRGLGVVLAAIGWFVVSVSSSVVVSIAVSAILTAVVVAAAHARFINGPEFEAEPEAEGA